MLWLRVLGRIGPAKATLAGNLQPFVAAVVALVLLSERITWVQVAGGVLIGAGIALARRRHTLRNTGIPGSGFRSREHP